MKAHSFLIRMVLILGIVVLIEFIFGVNILKEKDIAKADTKIKFYDDLKISYQVPISIVQNIGGEQIFSSDGVIYFDDLTITSAKIWQTNSKELDLYFEYQLDKNLSNNNDIRMLLLFRDSDGSPWTYGDFSAYEPKYTGEGGLYSGNVLVKFVFNSLALSTFPLSRANSTIELGVFKGIDYSIGGPGQMTSDERASLTPLQTLIKFKLSLP